MNYQIIVFTMNGCIYCTDLKSTLSQKNIKFIEAEVSNYPKIWKQVINQTGYNVLPTVFLKQDGTEEGPIYIAGKDFDTPEEFLEKIKSKINFLDV